MSKQQKNTYRLVRKNVNYIKPKILQSHVCQAYHSSIFLPTLISMAYLHLFPNNSVIFISKCVQNGNINKQKKAEVTFSCHFKNNKKDCNLKIHNTKKYTINVLNTIFLNCSFQDINLKMWSLMQTMITEICQKCTIFLNSNLKKYSRLNKHLAA